jgi:hypothetical protein
VRSPPRRAPPQRRTVDQASEESGFGRPFCYFRKLRMTQVAFGPLLPTIVGEPQMLVTWPSR